MDFEEAYATREVLREQNSKNIVSVTMSAQSDTVDVIQSEDGWVVRFQVVGPAIQYEEGHVDPGMYVASYFISDQTIRRVQADETTVDPRTKGFSVSCPSA
ncbi:hypothetical protein BG842_02965 [Haladaptatus sp. W1]|uniref:hypothetical protein n=1 Tax=Haladaptatus sp. W1 TaxID=1897478 RepID=UPI000849CCA4|nr:hypothetical protein [Haladaptatus sp. W1]ODR80042.1 hypothetical protein BG842_02965 [Haladaptatus sp. W1]